MILFMINLTLLHYVCVYDREGIIASGAADDAIRLFVENNEGMVCKLLILCFGWAGYSILATVVFHRRWLFKFFSWSLLMCFLI